MLLFGPVALRSLNEELCNRAPKLYTGKVVHLVLNPGPDS